MLLFHCTCYGLLVVYVVGASTSQLISRELPKKLEPEVLSSGHAFTETIQHTDGRITVQVHYREPGGSLGKHIFELNHVKSTKVEEDPKKKRKFIPNNNSQLVARQTINKLIKDVSPNVVHSSPRLRRPAIHPDSSNSWTPSAAQHRPRYASIPVQQPAPVPVFTPAELDPQSALFANTPAVHNPLHFDSSTRLESVFQPQYSLAYQEQLPIQWPPPEENKYLHQLPSYAQLMYEPHASSYPQHIQNGEYGYSYVNFFREGSDIPISSVQVLRGPSAPSNFIPWQPFLRPHLADQLHSQHYADLPDTSAEENYKQASENAEITKLQNDTEILNSNEHEDNKNATDIELVVKGNTTSSEEVETSKEISEEETRKVEKIEETPSESEEEATTTGVSPTTTPLPVSSSSTKSNATSSEESNDTTENEQTE